jgi:hypothetical protein
VSYRYKDAESAVYRVHIDRLLADRSAVYMTQTYGPYTRLGTAKGQATTLLKYARSGNQQAEARIEKSKTDWIEL